MKLWRISPFIRKTYFTYSPVFSNLTSADVRFKMENLQVTGSFKARGAINKLLSLTKEQKQKGGSNEDLELMKIDMLEVIFRLLVIHLGTPPSSFIWQFRDKGKNFHRYENLSPKSFYSDHVKLDLNDYVCLINCPMSDKKFNKVYTIEFLGNVVEGLPIRYLNVETSIMKKAAVKSIKNGDPVWFGCDVSKHFHRELGIMDIDLFDFDTFYGTKFRMDKASRLEYGDSQMTHAMLFTGVDLDANGNPTKWRVETVSYTHLTLPTKRIV